MRVKNTKVVISVLVATALIITFMSAWFSHHQDRSNIDRQLFNTRSQDGSLRLITISSDGSLLDGAIYSISPNPFGDSSSYITRVSSPASGESTHGIIMISGLRPGDYNVTELRAPKGYLVNGSSKIVELTSKHIYTAAFIHLHSNGFGDNASQIRDLVYSVKFECGSVSGNDGPLRPGHYDTDISIFNRQVYTVPFLWNAVVNNGKDTTSILRILQPQTSASIICKDIFQLFNVHNNTDNIIEGFILIRPQLDTDGLGSFLGNSATVFSHPLVQDQGNLLDVQVFYSANALLTLPRNITMDKVVFSIVNDTSGKIPISIIKKPLDITLESQINRIIDPESQVKNSLAAEYDLSSAELAHIKIQIISVSMGASTMVDDHAISSFQVRPQSVGQ